jgi:adenine/guanine phosphoribosyltransferase-like PRPP-binding protein
METDAYIANAVSPWGESAPDVIGYTSIGFLKRCNGYEAAKKGDLASAKRVVESCTCKKMLNIRQLYPDAVVLPVITGNSLPVALALHIGLPICHSVLCLKTMQRKSLSAMQRILYKPVFCGCIQAGMSYILVDDVVTQGGTIAALWQFVAQAGGSISAVVALAYDRGSKTIRPAAEKEQQLDMQFGHFLSELLERYDTAFAPNCLTNSQIQYLLKYSQTESMQKIASKSIAR